MKQDLEFRRIVLIPSYESTVATKSTQQVNNLLRKEGKLKSNRPPSRITLDKFVRMILFVKTHQTGLKIIKQYCILINENAKNNIYLIVEIKIVLLNKRS